MVYIGTNPSLLRTTTSSIKYIEDRLHAFASSHLDKHKLMVHQVSLQHSSNPENAAQIQTQIKQERIPTLWLRVRKSSMAAICIIYLASLSSSRSAIACGVCAFLNAWIFSPSLGLSAKLRLCEKAQNGLDEVQILMCSPDHLHELYSSRCYLTIESKIKRILIILKTTDNLQKGKVIPDDLERLNWANEWWIISQAGEEQ